MDFVCVVDIRLFEFSRQNLVATNFILADYFDAKMLNFKAYF
jgi:hypothetical protein